MHGQSGCTSMTACWGCKILFKSNAWRHFMLIWFFILYFFSSYEAMRLHLTSTFHPHRGRRWWLNLTFWVNCSFIMFLVERPHTPSTNLPAVFASNQVLVSLLKGTQGPVDNSLTDYHFLKVLIYQCCIGMSYMIHYEEDWAWLGQNQLRTRSPPGFTFNRPFSQQTFWIAHFTININDGSIRNPRKT